MKSNQQSGYPMCVYTYICKKFRWLSNQVPYSRNNMIGQLENARTHINTHSGLARFDVNRPVSMPCIQFTIHLLCKHAIRYLRELVCAYSIPCVNYKFRIVDKNGIMVKCHIASPNEPCSSLILNWRFFFVSNLIHMKI